MTPINAQKQQELFEEFVIREKRKGKLFGAFKFKKPIFPQQRLTLSFSYETLIIMLIGVVLAASILFSLGVERGRGMELSPAYPSPIAVQSAVEIAPENAVTEPAARPEKKQEAVKAVVPPVPAEDKPFTIQVASYKTRDLAEKELTRLKKKGYSSDILKKGDYFILCVGSYAKKELAKQALPYWERQYKGCIVRKR